MDRELGCFFGWEWRECRLNRLIWFVGEYFYWYFWNVLVCVV